MADVWVRRLADLPGFDDAVPCDIQRSMLPGHDSTPRIHTYSWLDETPRQSVMWPSLDGTGETSASPAKQHGYRHGQDALVSLEDVVQHLCEALELPGEPSDYHFIILGAIEHLSSFRLRLTTPSVMATVERLCWLDIQLIEAFPDIIIYERDGQRLFAAVPAFGRLVALYEREGFLHEALAVAERELPIGGSTTQVEKLRERIAIVDAEDAG